MPDINSQLLSIFTTLVTSVGLIGNTLNFVVLNAYHTSQIACAGGESTARLNLLGLAIADFFVCLTTLPLTYVKRRYNEYSFMAFYTIIGPALATYSLTISAWMVLLLSLVRCMAVCYPLASRSWLTAKHMWKMILALYILALAIHIPTFLWYKFEELDCRDFNQTNNCQLTIVVEQRWTDESIHTAYHVTLIILTNIGPFLGVVLSYLAVIRACRRSDQCRRSFIEAGRAEAQSPTQQPTNFNFNTDSGQVPHAGEILGTPPAGQHRDFQKSSLQRYPSMATNRVTPLLLAVIFAFLLFTAPFGIVHFICMSIMTSMGNRLLDDVALRKLYRALNLTVSWTNAVQLLGSASNFFLYFLVSTTFRRTTKRTFVRFYKRLGSCRKEFVNAFRVSRWTRTSDSWERDERTNELRRELDMKFNQQNKTWKGHNWLNRAKRNLNAQPCHSIESHELIDRRNNGVSAEANQTIPEPMCACHTMTNHNTCRCGAHCSMHIPLFVSSCPGCERTYQTDQSKLENRPSITNCRNHCTMVHSEPCRRIQMLGERQYRSVGEVHCPCMTNR